jgi:hypothetical protein
MPQRLSALGLAQRLPWLFALALAAASVAPAVAYAGGPFEQIIGVGARAHSTQVNLSPSGSRSEDSLVGTRAPTPSVGYVLVYPLLGGLPGIPGQYYPAVGVLCLSWSETPSNCVRLGSQGRRLLAPLTQLPRLHGSQTRLVGVTPGVGALRTANVHLALALALTRHPSLGARPSRPGALALTLTWRGPEARHRPTMVQLDARGVWARGHLYPTPRGLWAYIAANAPPA